MSDRPPFAALADYAGKIADTEARLVASEARCEQAKHERDNYISASHHWDECARERGEERDALTAQVEQLETALKERQSEAFVMGFAVSDENFNGTEQRYDEFAEVFAAFERGELVPWLEVREWSNSLVFLPAAAALQKEQP